MSSSLRPTGDIFESQLHSAAHLFLRGCAAGHVQREVVEHARLERAQRLEQRDDEQRNVRPQQRPRVLTDLHHRAQTANTVCYDVAFCRMFDVKISAPNVVPCCAKSLKTPPPGRCSPDGAHLLHLAAEPRPDELGQHGADGRLAHLPLLHVAHLDGHATHCPQRDVRRFAHRLLHNEKQTFSMRTSLSVKTQNGWNRDSLHHRKLNTASSLWCRLWLWRESPTVPPFCPQHRPNSCPAVDRSQPCNWTTREIMKEQIVQPAELYGQTPQCSHLDSRTRHWLLVKLNIRSLRISFRYLST